MTAKLPAQAGMEALLPRLDAVLQAGFRATIRYPLENFEGQGKQRVNGLVRASVARQAQAGVTIEQQHERGAAGPGNPSSYLARRSAVALPARHLLTSDPKANRRVNDASSLSPGRL